MQHNEIERTENTATNQQKISDEAGGVLDTVASSTKFSLQWDKAVQILMDSKTLPLV